MEEVRKHKTCLNCQEDFPIMEKDLEFYEMMEVTEPTHCPICRMQRRLSYRNERFLYHRTCALTGQKTLSSFSEDKAFPIYTNDAWWTDEWDELSYGRDFDFSRPFFEQFFELRDSVPRLALQQQKPMWNSDYCNCASQNKNCYLVFSTNRCEDCYYGSWVNDCKDCIDNKTIVNCELCYDCVNCYDCYDLKYSQDCSNCKNSYFLRDCSGCMNCFACSNLHNKEYYIFNEKKTREEYEEFMSKVDLGSSKVIQDGKKRAQEMLKDLTVKEFHSSNIENSIGDYLYNCKNAYMSFDCDNVEDARYCVNIERCKSSMDHSHWGGGTERIYECQACGYDNFNLRFCNLCWSGCSDLTYCDQCFSSKNSFASVGLRKKEYCIFNKQYSKEDFEKLRDKIIEHMKTTGEWGEFFPTAHSCYAYNETLAQEQVPLTKDQVIAKNWLWIDQPKEENPSTYKAPDNIKDATEAICNETLSCQSCQKNYKIIPQEFSFYQRQNIPIPIHCADCRHYQRMKLKNLRRMFQRQCQACEKEITSPYAPERPEKVLCEACYLKEIY